MDAGVRCRVRCHSLGRRDAGARTENTSRGWAPLLQRLGLDNTRPWVVGLASLRGNDLQLAGNVAGAGTATPILLLSPLLFAAFATAIAGGGSGGGGDGFGGVGASGEESCVDLHLASVAFAALLLEQVGTCVEE